MLRRNSLWQQQAQVLTGLDECESEITQSIRREIQTQRRVNVNRQVWILRTKCYGHTNCATTQMRSFSEGPSFSLKI